MVFTFYRRGTDRPHRWRRGNQAQNYGHAQPRRGKVIVCLTQVTVIFIKYFFCDNSLNNIFCSAGNPEDAGNTPRQNCAQEGDPAVVPLAAGNTSDDVDSFRNNKFPRSGRFAYQHRFKDNTRFSNGSTQHTEFNEPVASKQSEGKCLNVFFFLIKNFCTLCVFLI